MELFEFVVFYFRNGYARIRTMKDRKEKITKRIKTIISILLIILGVVCGIYAVLLYLSGFGGMLSFVWLVPCLLCFFVVAVLKDKIQFKKWMKRMMLYVVVPIVTVFVVVELIILSGFFQKPKTAPDYIVVLGTTVYDHGPCYLLRQRLKEGAKWADEYQEAKIVVTGGQGPTEPFTEGSEMKRYLVEELGVDATRILVEEESMNTYENMTFTGKMLEDTDTNFSYEDSSILVVTNNFHMFRAMQITKKAGFENISGAPSGTYIYLFPHYMVREFFSIAKNLVLGRM